MHSMFPKGCLPQKVRAILWFTACVITGAPNPLPVRADVEVLPGEQTVEVRIDGQHFTTYHYTAKGSHRPFLYPVLNQQGEHLTRGWPQEQRPGEERDHPHHRGIFFGHRLVNGFHFWGDSKGSSTIRHDQLLSHGGGKDKGWIQTLNNYVTLEDNTLLTEKRTLVFYRTSEGRMMDWESVLTAGTREDVVFQDEKDGHIAIRIPTSMRVLGFDGKKRVPGEGHIVNSEGIRDDAAWGKRARWCDCYGPLQGRTYGVAMMDHPENPRFPTWWHARTYGLLAANPFGQHHFEKLSNKQAGDFLLPKGKSVTWKYRFYWHEGDETQGNVEQVYQSFAAQKGALLPSNP